MSECNPWNHREPLGLEQGGGTPLAFPFQRRGCQQVLMQWGTPHCVPVPLVKKTGGNGTRHTCVSVPFRLFSSRLLYRFAGRPPNFVMGSLT